MRKVLFSLGVLLLASLGMGQETGYNTNWSGHRTFHVNTFTNSSTATAIGANVVKYPMLVRLGTADSAIFAASKSTGADIRFTKSNNTVRLKHSIETWDSAGRRAALWVLLDTVYANNQAQNFRLHWGNGGAADSSQPTAVFDSANGFLAVWHMGNASGTAPRPNTVAGGSPATPAASVGNLASGFVPRAGLIGMADTLRSSGNVPADDDHFTLGSGYQFAEGTGTMSMWTKYIAAGNWHNFVSLSSGTGVGGGQTQGGMGNNVWFGRNNNTNNLQTRSSIKAPAGNGFFPADSGVEGTARNATGALSPNNVWAHFTVTFADSGRRRTIYKDGAMLADFPALAGGTRVNDSINFRNTIRGVTRTQTFLGRSQWGDRNYRGMIDEVRLSKVARSADWVLLDYASQNAVQTLVGDSTRPILAYAVDTIKAEAGFPITTVRTTALGGVPQPALTVDVALPAGLALTTANTNLGMISGTYTGTTSGTTRHIITATNGKGSVADTIYVTVTANPENYTTWSNIKTLSFNAAGIAGTINRFPFLLRLTSADAAVFTGAGANGASLRFSRTDAVKLKYSIDHWDAVNQRAAIWVLMDQVSPGANTLRMHWGNGTAASQSTPSAVFERSNGYVGVYHLGNPTGAAQTTARPNSVQPGGANDAMPMNLPSGYTVRTGAIGMADTLGGTTGTGTSTASAGQHLKYGTLDSTVFAAGGNANISMWVKVTSLPTAYMQYVTIGNTQGGENSGGLGANAMWLGKYDAGTRRLSAQNITATNNANRTDVTVDNTALLGQWQYLSFSVSGVNHTLYSNGVRAAFITSGQPLGAVTRVSNYIGRSTWNDPTLNGVVDEARISNVSRDSNWVKLEYASQRPNASPVSNLTYPIIGGSLGSPMTPRSPSLSGTAVNYSLSGTLPAGVVFNDTTGVFSGTPTAAGTASVTVTANSGVWSTSATVNMNFGNVDGAYGTAWSGHKFVSLNVATAGVTAPATMQKFPVLVRLGTADSLIFNASQNNGGDIRFTKLGDVIRLKHEIDFWDKAGRKAAIWVLADTIYGNTNGSRLRMHYGNASVADSSQGLAVFDSTAGYVGVFHLGNPAGSAQTGVRPNAARNGANNAVPVNFPTTATVRTGMIGMADTLTGGTLAAGTHLNYGTLPATAFTAGAGATISAWVNFASLGGNNSWVQFFTVGNTVSNNGSSAMWIGKTANNANNGQSGVVGTNRLASQNITGNSNVQPTFGTDNSVVLGEWALVTFTVSAGNHTLYKNGVSIGSRTDAPLLDAIERTANYIGRGAWSADANFTGLLDEARIANVARSADWVKLEYANQNAAQNLVALTDAQQAVGISAASRLMGPGLSFKALDKGLLFQIQGEAASRARLSVMDMQGRTVWNRTVTTGAGMTQVVWNGQSNKGQGIGSGVYVVRMALLDADGKITQRLDKKAPLTR